MREDRAADEIGAVGAEHIGRALEMNSVVITINLACGRCAMCGALFVARNCQ